MDFENVEVVGLEAHYHQRLFLEAWMSVKDPNAGNDHIVIPEVYLTNRFHVAVRLFSNRSQMTSKCGKNKKVAHEAIAECVTDVLTTFWCLL